MDDREYNFEGYYDCIDKVLYNSSYDIRDLIPTDNSIKVDSFDTVNLATEPLRGDSGKAKST